MIEVQKVAVVNDAAFVMSFDVQTPGGKTDSSGNYPIDQSRTIDLGDTPFREGIEIWPVIHVVLGKTKSADEHVIFKMNGQTATYEVRGATLTYSIKLLG